jgi:RNA polymerase sigma-70 factor (ECF subfamily)
MDAPPSDQPRPPHSDLSEPEAFGGFYEHTLLPLRRYLQRLLGNAGEAEEVAQDAYLRIYQKPAQKPEALLYTTARRLAINRLRRRQISPVAPTDATVDTARSTAPSVPSQVSARQEWDLLREAIDDLPPGCRQVLLLRKVELLSHREISERLGIAISTVEKQHARALRLLRRALPAETADSPFAQ